VIILIEKHALALAFLGLVAVIASVGLILTGTSLTGAVVEDSDYSGNKLTGNAPRYAAARSPAATPAQILYGRGGSSYVYTPPTPSQPSRYTQPQVRGEPTGACCYGPRTPTMCKQGTKTSTQCGYWGFYPGKTCAQACPKARRM
jgi:hypothetical protein